MIKKVKIRKRFIETIKEAVTQTLIDIKEERISQEEDISDRLMVRIQDRINTLGRYKGIEFEAKIYVRRSEEPQCGADIGGLLEINIQNYHITKAFLAQAKKGTIARYDISGNAVIRLENKDKIRKLAEQCRKMLRITPSSFVFIYAPNGIHVFPATTTLSDISNWNRGAYSISERLYSKSLPTFFDEYFKSFFGDTRIGTSIKDVPALEKFAEEYDVRNALHIAITSKEG